MKFELKESLRGASDEKLLDDLRRGAHILGKPTITMAEYAEVGKTHPSTIQRRFGSWPKALKLAGIEASRSKIGISVNELFDNLRSIWTNLGRQPSYGEIKTPLSLFSIGTYENRFGSWSNALNEFIVWINTDLQNDGHLPIENNTPTADTSIEKMLPSKRRTRREISERQRFRILVRDGFRCKSCGSSPLTKPGTELHVDHILPWSKGGETVNENLESKCAQCNLGKGNAFNV